MSRRKKEKGRFSDRARPIERFDLILGFDTEFVRNSELDCDPDVDGQNSVVSYQFCIFNPRTGAQESFWFQPEGRGQKNRLSLGGSIGRALYFAEQSGLIDTEDGRIWETPGKRDRIKIALVAHFTRADIPAFRDFRKLKTQFDSPRGTYATTERPAVIEIRLPDRRRSRSCSVTLFDTKLLAPAGYGSLSKLGEALNFPKLKLPEVIDETGAPTPGISRMDLTLAQHPEEFVDYAIRDAEVAVRWFKELAEFSYQWCVSDKIRPTIGALAVRKILQGREEIFAPILGRAVKQNPLTGKLSISDQIAEAAATTNLCSDAFHGGRNECHAVGIFGDGAPFYDWDECGAYTTAMAHFRSIDWAHVEHTKDLERLAVCDPLTYATVDFEFPDSVKYPSLPVQTDKYGIIFPLRGSTTTVGPELLVALNQGARIVVRVGMRLNWLEEGEGLIGSTIIEEVQGETKEAREARLQRRLLERVSKRPFAAYAQQVNISRAKAKKAAGGKKGSPHELLAKEAGNSGFGKLGQGVCNTKSTPERRKMFSSRAGDFLDLEPSRITAPHLAAYTSGLPRALLSEIISRLPDEVTLLNCTTDGFLSSLTPEQIDRVLAGPVARHFSYLRTLVAPDASPSVLELKHTASCVISAKTRGNFAIERGPDVDGKPSDLICARAGHRLEKPPEHDDQNERKRLENEEWLRVYLSRNYDTKLRGMVFNSTREQFEGNADLIDIWRDVRVNFCFDMKRGLIEETIENDPIYGMIRFNTEPWQDIDEFYEWRGDFDAWRAATGSCLKHASDWWAFKAWRENKRFRSAALRTPFQQWLVVAAAKGALLPRRTKARDKVGLTLEQLAELLTQAGVPGLTAKIIEHAANRETLQNTAPDLLAGDEIILENIIKIAPKTNAFFAQCKIRMCDAPQKRETHSQLNNKGQPHVTIVAKSNPPNIGSGDRGFGGLNASCGSVPAQVPEGLMNISDWQHVALMRQRLKELYGISRAAMDLAARKVPSELPGGERARALMALAEAVASKLKICRADAISIIASIAAETLPTTA